MHDDLPQNARIDFGRILSEHDDPNTDLHIGRKDPNGVGGNEHVVFRLEVSWNEDQRECSPWYDPYAFEAFLSGIYFNDDLLQKL